MADLKKIIDEFYGLTILEAAELVKQLEEKWGVSAAAAVAVAAGPAAASAAPAEEKTEFDLYLKKCDASKKLNIIKSVREVNSELGLKEAKELVEGVEKGAVLVKAGLSKDDAAKYKKILEDGGAEVEIK